jgi:murein DD-endopeptidase MepM/ murein hydrolase activator NlpD
MPEKLLRTVLALFLAGGVMALVHFNSVWNHTPIPGYIGALIQSFEEASRNAAFTSALLASPPADRLPVPVLGVAAREVADSFGNPRGSDRTHEGVDIFAPRGTYVLSATEGIVARIGTNRLGGNVVFVIGPGGERYYYAHLDAVDAALSLGQRVGTGTILGTVGTTGNATGTPPHLHFGIYGARGAEDPYPRIEAGAD